MTFTHNTLRKGKEAAKAQREAAEEAAKAEDTLTATSARTLVGFILEASTRAGVLPEGAAQPLGLLDFNRVWEGMEPGERARLKRLKRIDGDLLAVTLKLCGTSLDEIRQKQFDALTPEERARIRAKVGL
ncbi:MAG: hypothetical protein JW918_01030 [Anaerolineae bacterium]|nr:hypothetical protein [Anaerolineae bacterium]